MDAPKLPETLPPGTLLEFDGISCVVVGEDLLLVFESVSSFAKEGDLLRLIKRGSNDWGLRLGDVEDWFDNLHYWVKRDWNGRLKVADFDPYDWSRDDDWDDYDWNPYLDEIDQIYDDNGW